jgi:hypothetical protein
MDAAVCGSRKFMQQRTVRGRLLELMIEDYFLFDLHIRFLYSRFFVVEFGQDLTQTISLLCH